MEWDFKALIVKASITQVTILNEMKPDKVNYMLIQEAYFHALTVYRSLILSHYQYIFIHCWNKNVNTNQSVCFYIDTIIVPVYLFGP